MLLPLKVNVPHISIKVKADKSTTIDVQLRASLKNFNFTTDMILFQKTYNIAKGKQALEIHFN